jgi:hypothetical protein
VKVDVAYYRDVSMSEQLLPAMRHIAEDFYIFQQDSSPAHRARQTIELLQHETPCVITPDLQPLSCPDLDPVDYRI